MRADQIVHSVDRGVLVGRICRIAWFVLLTLSIVIGPAIGSSAAVTIQVVLFLAMWIGLTAGGMRQSRVAMQWPVMIAQGQIEQAEEQIDKALRGFTVLSSVKLLGLHHLARIRLSQKRWADAATLSRGLLRYPLRTMPGLSAASYQILAEASMRLGDLSTAFVALQQLRRQKLSLDQSLGVLLLETVYLARIGAWPSLMDGIKSKLRLAELMPTDAAATTQGLLAVAAQRRGREDWVNYLRSRCDLLADMSRLAAEETCLQTIWPPAAPRLEMTHPADGSQESCPC
jgi:hypothetical protein